MQIDILQEIKSGLQTYVYVNQYNLYKYLNCYLRYNWTYIMRYNLNYISNKIFHIVHYNSYKNLMKQALLKHISHAFNVNFDTHI